MIGEVPRPGPFVRRLRAETRPSHDRTETLAPLATLLSPALDRASYALALRLLHRFFEPVDRQLLRARLEGWDYARARRFPLLEDDLHALSVEPWPPSPGTEEALAEDVDLIAHAYLLEGSALGGRQLAKLVERRLGLTPATGLAWFHGHGADAGDRWLRFLAYLEGWVTTTGAADATIAAVHRAYGRLALVAGA